MDYKPINILEDIVARQIAAGEVIDRPAAILRELIDNSIDADASHIEVILKNYGLDLVQVSDNGIGIKKEDLKKACIPHATSKILTSNDLLHISSMGFRGEALASIATVTRLSITSKNRDEKEAWHIQANNTHISELTETSRDNGTTMKAENLFYDIPARKKFLATPHTELNYLRTMLLRKAAAFPHIAFSLQHETHTPIKLPQELPLQRSIRICAKDANIQDFVWIDTTQSRSNPDIAMKAAIGLPNIAQNNRRNMFVYINNRIIKDFSLLQAIEYAYRNTLHGSKYPQIVLFLQIPPQQIDVNIHPAKTEVKIKGIEPVRSLIISTIEKQLASFAQATPQITHTQLEINNPTIENTPHNSSAQNLAPTVEKAHHTANNNDTSIAPTPTSSYDALFPSQLFSDKNYSLDKPHTAPTQVSTPPLSYSAKNPLKSTSQHTTHTILQHTKNTQSPSDSSVAGNNLDSISQKWRFMDTLFATYLLFEQKHSDEKALLILDFHATHERLIFDQLLNNTLSTKLLIPVPLSLNTDTANIVAIIEQYKQIGIIITKSDTNEYVLSEIPAHAPIDADTIASLIEDIPLKEQLNTTLFATKACRKAAKAGDHVDTQGAYTLLSQALNLESPRCPHGRPLWLTITKHTLDTMIGRIS